MIAGCRYCKRVENDLRVFSYCELSLSGCSYKIKCAGSLNEKKNCPQWGPTVAAEKYYQKKLKNEK